MLILYTDTDTDLTLKEANYYGYKMISMPYLYEGKEVKPYEDFLEFDYKEFYDMLRRGVLPTTCALSPEVYKKYFEEEFKNGNDILYVHFSKAMSGTFNSMHVAYKELKEKYPERTLYTIDTKGITILSNIIVKEIGEMYKQGKTIEEILDWTEKEVDHFATYFFADDLKFFKRSGRISNFSAIMGNIIGIKPIIYMDQNGQMTNIGKERGKVKALARLVNYVKELSVDIDKHKVIIGHADALDLAHELGDLLIKEFNNKLDIEYVAVNPTAGSHCGPDTVGVAFYAKHK